LYFYELHESDDELFNDALLAHAEDFSEDEFFDLVMETRAKVLDSFEEDTLVVAVARELERSHDFVYIDNRHLRAAVNVSVVEEDNVLAEIDERDEEDDENGDDDEDEVKGAMGGNADRDDPFRTLVVRVDRPDLN
jgi:hypothetical protein